MVPDGGRRPGHAPGGRRRAAGPRGEELATLTGISVDYLTRLEQARATSPSGPVVEALARAARLSDDERELLFRLAGLTVPGSDVVSTRITPSVQRLLDRLSHNPLVVYDATWTAIEANAAYDALMGETTTWRGLERNGVWRHLVGQGSRAVQTEREHAEMQAQLVGDLRLTAARYPADRRVQALVRELRAASPRFADLWESPDPIERHDPGRHKVVDHPEVGLIAVACDTLIVAGDDLRIMVYTAEPGTEHPERLELGTQAVAG